jgi:alpha-galactosidase
MPSLSNQYLEFVCDADSARWELTGRASGRVGLRVSSIRCGAAFRTADHGLVRWTGQVVQTQFVSRAGEASPHGPLQVLTVDITPRLPAVGGLSLRLEAALPAAQPFLLWHLTARNLGDQTLALETLDLAVMALDPRPASGLAFFANGYQSWSFAGALLPGQRQPASGLGPFSQPLHLNLVTPRPGPPGHFVSDMFGVVGGVGPGLGLVAGFISQREQFGHLAVNMPGGSARTFLQLSAQCDGVTLAPGQERTTDWAYLQFVDLDVADPLQDYVEAVARENSARVPSHTPIGWCSWYHYFDKVTEQDLMSNLEAAALGRDRLPLDIVQLDDGYQTQVGDWFGTKPTFPSSLKALTARVGARGHIPGVWLAPYIVRSDAQLWRAHPDWLLRGSSGRPANAGFAWFKWCYGLDPTHPGVREHTHRLIETAVREWGFPYLKLDFLYAAALPGRRFNARFTRAQAMRLALTDMRDAAGDATFLLGCGCPLGSAVGLIDGMRIGADVAPDWLPVLFSQGFSPLLRQEREMPSARNAIQNIISRAPLHRRWWLNDPDCLLARNHDTRLTEAEVRSLATVIALSGGLFLVSDDLAHLSPARRRYLTPLLPVLDESARAPGWMRTMMPDLFTLPLSGPAGQWLVAGLFNWTDATADGAWTLADLGLDPGGDYWISDFWEGRCWKQPGAPSLTFKAMPAHGGHLVAIRRAGPAPAVMASSFHFSQGKEITAWQSLADELTFTLELGRLAEGELRLALPAAPAAAMVDGQAVPVRSEGPGVYALAFTVNRMVQVRVMFQPVSNFVL